MKLEYSGSGGSSCTEVVLSLIILFCESDLSTLAIIAVYFSIDDLLSKVIKILLKSFNQCDQCSSLVKLTWFGSQCIALPICNTFGFGLNWSLLMKLN